MLLIIRLILIKVIEVQPEAGRSIYICINSHDHIEVKTFYKNGFLTFLIIRTFPTHA